MRQRPARDGVTGWRALGQHQRHVLVATLATNALLFFDQTAVVVALPALQREFHASSAQLQWAVTAYLLALASFMVLAGRLGDRFGRKRMLLGGLTVFGLASAACAAAPGLGFLIAARFAQGIGGALMQPLALGTTTRVVDEQQRGWAVGLLSTGGTTFLALGPVIASVIVDLADWRWLFVANLPVVVFSLYQGSRWIEPSREPAPGPIEGGTLVLLVAGLAAAVTGISWLAVWGPLALVPLAVGVVLLGLFGGRELRSAHPMIPLGMLGHSRMLLASLAALFAIQFAVLGTTVYLVLFLQHGLGERAFVAGLVLALAGVFTPLLSVPAGRLTDRRGPRPLVVGGLVLATAGLVWLGSVAPLRGLLVLLPGLLLFGLSRPAVFTPASAGPFAALPPERRGLVGGLVTEARQLGAVLGVVVLGAVFAGVRGTDLTEAASVDRGFQAAMLAAAGVTALAAVTVLLVMPRHRPGRAARPADPA